MYRASCITCFCVNVFMLGGVLSRLWLFAFNKFEDCLAAKLRGFGSALLRHAFQRRPRFSIDPNIDFLGEVVGLFL